MKNLKFIFVAMVAVLFSTIVAVAQEKPQTLTLPSAVGNNMVLQQSATVNIWGLYGIPKYFPRHRASQVAQTVKNLPAMRETWV